MSKYMYEILKRENKDKGIVLVHQVQEPRWPKKPRKPKMTLAKLAEMFVEFREEFNTVIKLNNLRTK